MRAMLYAAGLGTRLRPLTDHMPKALVTVGGRSLLQITAERLAEAGTDLVVINVHHFAQQIKDYVATHDLKMNVLISDESEQLLNTGGGLKKALTILAEEDTKNVTIDKGQPILIHNVDILSNADLRQFYADHKDADVALLVSERKTQRYLLFNEEMHLVGWTNIATGEVRTPYADLDVKACHKYAFSGIHIVNPIIGELMQDYPAAFPIMDFYIQQCAKLTIRGVLDKELRLLDVGKQDSITAAEEFLQSL